MYTQPQQPRLLWLLIVSYVVCLVMANWFDVRLVHIFGLDTDAGTIIFPLTFIVANLITEVYGYKQARRAIWVGFVFNLLFLLYGQLIIHLPSPAYAEYNQAFDEIFHLNSRIIFASIVSYFCAEPLNTYTLAKLKTQLDGRMLPVRFVSSTALAAGVDSFIFTSIAFSQYLNHHQALAIACGMWLMKVVIETVGLPLSTYLAIRLKEYERLDIYDKDTQFTLFSLNAEYPREANHYKPD